MSAEAVVRGLAPPEAELAAQDANAAAQSWLANETHMTYARRWLTAVAKELAPYSAKNTIVITEPGEREGETQDNETAGPLLFVALDDAVAFRPDSEAPELSRYLAELRGALIRGGLDAMTFVNARNVAGQGAPSFSIGSPAQSQTQPGIAGQWLFQPSVARAAAPASAPAQISLLTTGGRIVSGIPRGLARNAVDISAVSLRLSRPPHSLPPAISRANQPSPENTLLASRLLLGSGIRAIVYSPLQDTLTPAGWETPSAARYFRWDAALDLAGNRGPRASGVCAKRSIRYLPGAPCWPRHIRARDFGIVDLRACPEMHRTKPANSTARASHGTIIPRGRSLAGFAPELVNPAAQSVERLLRDPVILLPVQRRMPAIFNCRKRRRRRWWNLFGVEGSWSIFRPTTGNALRTVVARRPGGPSNQ